MHRSGFYARATIQVMAFPDGENMDGPKDALPQTRSGSRRTRRPERVGQGRRREGTACRTVASYEFSTAVTSLGGTAATLPGLRGDHHASAAARKPKNAVARSRVPAYSTISARVLSGELDRPHGAFPAKYLGGLPRGHGFVAHGGSTYYSAFRGSG